MRQVPVRGRRRLTDVTGVAVGGPVIEPAAAETVARARAHVGGGVAGRTGGRVDGNVLLIIAAALPAPRRP